MQPGAFHDHGGALQGSGSQSHTLITECIRKAQSFAQMCLERKSLFECARQSFKVIVGDVEGWIFSLYPGCESRGRRGGGFQSRDHTVAGHLALQCEGCVLFVSSCQ